MRPLELTLEGFRSYRTRARFDFRGRRLVGIVGPIGAGKSSLLDAVAFALYGKTPVFEKDTRSLIHQLCDTAHVELVFEMDGQVWRAQRGLRRKGQSGHKLERLDRDAPDATALESVQLDRNVRERVERLLGMDFGAFCRSVLLAQNRFQEFLKATPTQRNEVLKGVFGYERFDAALAIAKDRVRDADATLAALQAESAKLKAATEQRDQAAEDARAASEALAKLDEAAPRIAELTEAATAALRAAQEHDEAVERLRSVALRLPSGDEVEGSLSAAEGAAVEVERAQEAARTAEEAARAAQAELQAVSERVGDRTAFVRFAELVARLDHEARAAETAQAAASSAAAALAEAERAQEAATEREGTAREAAARAGGALAAATDALAAAESLLHEARHAEMAAELRGNLTEGDPCPVCEQAVAKLPRKARTPGVAAAQRKVDGVKAALERARREAGQAEAEMAAAAAEAAAAAKTTSKATTALEQARRDEASAIAALSATKSELTDRLGQGDPRELLQVRVSELAAAESASARAEEDAKGARALVEEARESQARTAKAVTELATLLTSVWAQVGEPRTVAAETQAVRDAAVRLADVIAERASAEAAAAKEASAEHERASAELERDMHALGLNPQDDFQALRAAAAAHSAAAAARLQTLEQALEAGADIAERIRSAEAARGLAARLAGHLQPAQFLTYLLEEERAALADLGSLHLEELTGGAYRFTSDDSFRIVDVNAGAAERSADSLSGGETFLASLALALALAEMVSRGGGRLDAFFLDEGFGSLDAEHIERAMDGIGRLVSGADGRLVVLVSHVEQMRHTLEDLIVLDKDQMTGDTLILSGASTTAHA
jgi:exonuclease SbcC